MFDKVRDIIVNVCQLLPEDVTLESSLTVDLGLNSFELVNLIIAFEEEFDIEVSDEELDAFDQVSDIVEYLENILE